MSDKEIEKVLKDIKDKYSYEPYDCTGEVYTTISYEEGQLLLSYIEQLENNRDKAIDKVQYIIDYGFDYDGFNSVESLKALIDMLVDYARDTKEILKGDSDE